MANSKVLHTNEGDFTLVKKMGHGGYSSVFEVFGKAEYEKDPMAYAMKLYSNTIDPDATIMINLFEIDILSRIRNPNIVRGILFFKFFYQLGDELAEELNHDHEEGADLYGVLEDLKMGSLYEFARDKYLTLSDEEKMETQKKFLYQITSSLKCLQEFNYIHTDVKPGNILYDENDNFFIADYGGCIPAVNDKITTILPTPIYFPYNVVAFIDGTARPSNCCPSVQRNMSYNISLWEMGLSFLNAFYGMNMDDFYDSQSDTLIHPVERLQVVERFIRENCNQEISDLLHVIFTVDKTALDTENCFRILTPNPDEFMKILETTEINSYSYECIDAHLEIQWGKTAEWQNKIYPEIIRFLNFYNREYVHVLTLFLTLAIRYDFSGKSRIEIPRTLEFIFKVAKYYYNHNLNTTISDENLYELLRNIGYAPGSNMMYLLFDNEKIYRILKLFSMDYNLFARYMIHYQALYHNRFYPKFKHFSSISLVDIQRRHEKDRYPKLTFEETLEDVISGFDIQLDKPSMGIADQEFLSYMNNHLKYLVSYENNLNYLQESLSRLRTKIEEFSESEVFEYNLFESLEHHFTSKLLFELCLVSSRHDRLEILSRSRYVIKADFGGYVKAPLDFKNADVYEPYIWIDDYVNYYLIHQDDYGFISVEVNGDLDVSVGNDPNLKIYKYGKETYMAANPKSMYDYLRLMGVSIMDVENGLEGFQFYQTSIE